MRQGGWQGGHDSALRRGRASTIRLPDLCPFCSRGDGASHRSVCRAQRTELFGGTQALGKGTWPFRLGHFFASATKAQVELGWKPEHDFAEDMKECLERYIESGRAEEEIDFTEDDKILMASGL
jgi:hypothetical protein